MPKKILIIGDETISLEKQLHMFSGGNYVFLQISINEAINSLEDFLKVERGIQYAIVFIKEWNTNKFLLIEDMLSKTNLKWLYITNIFNNIFVGPLREKYSKGCIDCFYYRWFMTKKDRLNLYKIREYIESKDIKGLYFNNITSSTIQLIMNLALNLIRSLKEQSVYLIDKETLKFNLHNFKPNSHCKICRHFEPESKEKTIQTFEKALSNINESQKEYRSISKQELTKSLENYLDTQTGLFNTLLDDYESPFAVSVANLPLKVGKDEVGVGRTNSYSDSHLTAMLEGLERYCGMEPRRNITNITGSYNDLKSEALDPSLLGLHFSSQYRLDHFPFEEFDPNRKIKWVWGYSITKRKPVLVPETYAYYGLNYRDGLQNSFVYEISNGCALGGSILEATLHALFEIVERDAFLISWYTRLPLERIELESIQDANIQLMINRFEYLTDYEITLYNMTLDSKIPCIWAIAKNKKEEGLNILCAAGSHLNKFKAIENTLQELCGILIALQKKFKNRKQELKKMLKDFSLVKNMEDHSLLFGLKEAESYFDFLLKNRNSIDLSEIKTINYTNNLHLDLQEVIKHFINLDLNIIVVDQTAEELDSSGLKCVKVIVPGMLPMTFGHDMRRLQKLPRLFSVPESLGYSIPNKNELLKNKAIPHPFP